MGNILFHNNLILFHFILFLFISSNEVCTWAFEVQRRTVISSILSNAIAPPTNLPLIERGGVTRVEGIGGGFDMMQPQLEKGVDAVFPASMVGTWKCSRTVVSMEGDIGQAEIAWRNLGGSLDKPMSRVESYVQTFITPPSSWNLRNDYDFEGNSYKGAILERGLDISSRRGDVYNVSWNVDTQTLTYETNNQKIEISVVQRKVEYPSANGFGFDELYRITSSAGGLFLGDNTVQRAVRVKRRYRRALDANGNRIVDGIELMNTYRVLDGIAGTEMPTSTTKSQIQLSRN